MRVSERNILIYVVLTLSLLLRLRKEICFHSHASHPSTWLEFSVDKDNIQIGKEFATNGNYPFRLWVWEQDKETRECKKIRSFVLQHPPWCHAWGTANTQENLHLPITLYFKYTMQLLCFLTQRRSLGKCSHLPNQTSKKHCAFWKSKINVDMVRKWTVTVPLIYYCSFS